MSHTKFATIIAVILFAAVRPSVAQEDLDEPVILPEAVMQQVVSRIIRWNFRPGTKPRTVPIADLVIKPEWLPSISNITFQTVSENDVVNYEKGVFFFRPVERDGTAYTINFGRGDLACDADGETWKFIVRDSKVRLWRTGHGWGQACGGDISPIVRGLKVGDVSPNELQGYKFFTEGKLKNIRIGLSTREDMKRIFGATCEGRCDYDENWQVFVNYFGDGGPTTISKSSGEFELIPKPGFIGTLRIVKLIPKRRISFSRVSFPRRFAKSLTYAIGDAWGVNGFEGAVHSTSDVYGDGYGLSYSVYRKETFNNLRNQQKSREDVRTGDLLEIEYSIPDSLDDVVYTRRLKAKLKTSHPVS